MLLSTKTKSTITLRKYIYIIILLLVIGNMDDSAWSQGFMIKPMRISIAARPGQTVEQILELRNTLSDKNHAINIKLEELIQGDNGIWMVGTSDTSVVSITQGRSCIPWLRMDTETLNIKPMESSKVKLKIIIPPSARGVYAAGMTAQTRPDPNATGVSMLLRFLIPIIVEIQGPPIKQQVDLTSAGLIFLEKTTKAPAKTLVSVDVDNTGEAFSRLKPMLKISKKEGNRWRPLSTIQFDEKKILPCQTVRLTHDLPRNFPSGQYQLIATLGMEGRPNRPLTREVDFIGDPTVSSVAADVKLSLEPANLECNVVPGSRRTVYVTLRNPSDENLMITGSAEQPQVLKGVMLGEIKGDDYSANSWAHFNPTTFPLYKNSERKIAVQLTFPREDLDKAAYYADLKLAATYADGQSAGIVKSLIIAKNTKAVTAPRMYGQGLSVVQSGSNQYNVNAVFANVGNIYLDPDCRGVLLATNMMSIIKPFEMKRDPGLVLPLGTPTFTGTLDATDVSPGTYVLKVECGPGSKPGTESFPVKVTEKDGIKSMEVIGELTRE